MTDTFFLQHRDPPRPHIGLDTYLVVDHAVVELGDRRFMTVLDAAVQLHLLASLVAQADVLVGEQVALARETGVSWAVIGRLLGVSATAARQRYGAAPKEAAGRAQPSPRAPLVD